MSNLYQDLQKHLTADIISWRLDQENMATPVHVTYYSALLWLRGKLCTYFRWMEGWCSGGWCLMGVGVPVWVSEEVIDPLQILRVNSDRTSNMAARRCITSPENPSLLLLPPPAHHPSSLHPPRVWPSGVGVAA